MWERYHLPATLDEALDLLDFYGASCRVIAGGTDLLLELERGQRSQRILVDISRIPGLDEISVRDGQLRLGPLVTHNQVVASDIAVERAFPLASACWQVGAPQIRNRGTVAGNLITASPANDTITPLWAMDAEVVLASRRRGCRTLSFSEFFRGVRRTAMADDELLLYVNVPLLGQSGNGAFTRGAFRKLGLRRAQAISLVNTTVVLEFDETAGHIGSAPVVHRARIALGAVAPTIVRAIAAEASLADIPLTEDAIVRAAELSAQAARPISDIRAEAWYRLEMVKVLVAQALRELRDGEERTGFPVQPVKLWGNTAGRVPRGGIPGLYQQGQPGTIRLRVNGKPVELRNAHGKTLLAALRDDLGLVGTKEGCDEGECGACTVQLDGMAVMSCLVPVERADGCSVVTVEGLPGPGNKLHPLQEAFVAEGAVQCGYCTPGMLMSGITLLEETPHPTCEQVQHALTGNLCRCTGYYNIVRAVERAGLAEAIEGESG